MATFSTSRIVVPLAGLHAAMFGYDLLHPELFLRADRARERIDVIQRFAALVQGGGDFAAFFAGHGIVGDWLPQALLYMAGGQYLVIAVQIALALASVAWLRELGPRFGLSAGGAAAAAALYGFLPHTLVFPHELASEAIFVPLVVLSFRLSLGAGSGLALGLATLIRPLTALWPFIHAAIEPAALKKRAAYVAWALVPLLAWMGFILAATGELSMGRSGHDLGRNLYDRMQRMAAPLPEAQRPAPRPEGQQRVSVGEYLRFCAEHPLAAAAHSARDLTVMGLKSGIERIVLDYLDLYPEDRATLQNSDGGWRESVEQRGPVKALFELLRARPGLVFWSALGAVLFLVFMALALVGAFSANAGAESRRRRGLLALFVLYVLATAQVVDAAQSRHRAPAEFALCLLAVAGWAALRGKRAQHLRSKDFIYRRAEPYLGR